MTPAPFGTAGALPLSSADDRTAAPWWTVFRDLRDARAALGLKSRHLTTLAALLSFLRPGGPMVVFAANRSILDRLNGLCERSLQRHVRDLAAAGLLLRQDSPNGKRFRLTGSDSTLAYGFDLAPLMARVAEIAALADAARAALHDARLWRQRVLDRLAALAGTIPAETEHPIRLMLRRPHPAQVWQEVLAQLDPISHAQAQVSAELSASDRQDVGHHQMSKEDVSIEGGAPPAPPEEGRNRLLRKLRDACPDMAQWIEGGLGNWDRVHAQIRRVAGWIGVGDSLYSAAATRIGPDRAAATLCGILQMGSRIRQPAAYFQSLTLGRRARTFDPVVLLNRLARGPHVIRG